MQCFTIITPCHNWLPPALSKMSHSRCEKPLQQRSWMATLGWGQLLGNSLWSLPLKRCGQHNVLNVTEMTDISVLNKLSSSKMRSWQVEKNLLTQTHKERSPPKNAFFGKFFQICEPTHPLQGFCEIWEHERWNSGQKTRFPEWGLGVWTLFGNQPPHPPIFGKDIPKKKRFFWQLP